MKPSIGRIVHYVSYGTPNGEYTSQCRAALVTEVINDHYIGLAAFNPTGMFFNQCDYDPEGSGGSWHWPEQV